MPVKIGTLLVEGGIITPEQLEEALQAQVMFGGRIGTNLIELGLISEEFLAQFLSKQLNIPFCHIDQLKNIPEETLDALSLDLVRRHRVIPVRKTKKEIWVAMVDPSSLETIDEMAFATNHKIFPMVAPEIQVVDAMERYYHIPREQRYVQLSASAAGEGAAMSLTHSTREFVDEGGSPMTSYAVARRSLPALQFPVAEVTAKKARAPVQKQGHKKDQLHLVSLADPLFPLHDIAQVLIDVRSKEDIFQAIRSPFMEFFDRVALFINKKDVMVGYEAYGEGFSKEKIETVAIPLRVPSMFREAVEKKIPVFGPIPNGHNNQRIAQLFNVETEGELCLLCPIPLVEKVGVIIYADRCHDPDAVVQRLDKFRLLMAKAGLAFQVLVLKQKILL